MKRIDWKRLNWKKYLSIVVAVLIIALPSWFKIPKDFTFSIQLMLIFALLGLMGGKRAALVVLIYTLLGVIGVPVFYNCTGGVKIFAGEDGGYFLSFLIATLIMWAICAIFHSEPGELDLAFILSMFAGIFVFNFFGSIWFVIYNAQNQTEVDKSFEILSAVSSWYLFPGLFPDGVMAAGAGLLVWILRKYIHPWATPKNNPAVKKSIREKAVSSVNQAFEKNGRIEEKTLSGLKKSTAGTICWLLAFGLFFYCSFRAVNIVLWILTVLPTAALIVLMLAEEFSDCRRAGRTAGFSESVPISESLKKCKFHKVKMAFYYGASVAFPLNGCLALFKLARDILKVKSGMALTLCIITTVVVCVGELLLAVFVWGKRARGVTNISLFPVAGGPLAFVLLILLESLIAKLISSVLIIVLLLVIVVVAVFFLVKSHFFP